ncbi:TolC family outer membrane protein [Tepidimonas aquatica]|uniref:Outer membrane protein TolC n=1 Tax=Tepidimonas aquatica TaxID=247482 RepID=A0A554WJT8_9BURK|nr:TolC family outer membrane protein [Tepidimonas aquatica]TSE23820.1 Outer membrane protein TolC [Tepidimonas aquatica]
MPSPSLQTLAARGPRWLRLGGAALIACAALSPAAALDLTEAYRLALDNDATVRAARAAAEAQRERLPQARAQLLPNIGASAARAHNDLTRTQANILGQPVTSDERYYSKNANLTLRQPLYRPALWAALEQARAVVADADATLQAELDNLGPRVASAYFETLYAHDQLALVREQVRVAQIQLDAAVKAWQAGTGTRTDVDEVQARLDLLRADELRARQQLDFTRHGLRALIDREPDALAVLDPQLLVLSPPQPLDLDAWVAKAEQGNPTLQALRARVQVAEQEVRRAQAGHLPTLDAYAQVTHSASENVTTPSSRYTNRSVGVQFNLPLYAGGGVNSATRQAMAELTRAQETLQATRRDLGVRLHREYRAITEGIERVRALERAVAAAEQAVISNQRSYEAGVRTVLDVLNAQQQRQTALRDLAQARYEVLLARVRLMALAGENVEAEIERINAALRAQP